MLKGKFFLTIVTLLVAISGCAYADNYDDTTFNFGLDLSFINRAAFNNSFSNASYFKASASDTKLAIQKNVQGVNAYVGGRFSENWGGQVGFSFLKNAKANVPAGKATNKVSNIFIDVLMFLNVAQNADLMGVLGYGLLKASPSVTNVSLYNQSALTKHKLGLRYGGGVQYYFAPGFATRISLIYQKGNPVFLKSLVSAAIGVVYTFNMD